MWRNYNLRELERQMSPRSAAVSMEAVFKEKREKGAAFRALHPDAACDIAYGCDLSETFDLFYPSHGSSHPLWVFIHGGYWQASDKRDVHDLATQMLAAGYAVATPNYALCPPSTLRRVVDQVRRCLLFIHEEAESLGIDASQFNIAGTSAGGHLAAIMACDPELPFIRSSLIISGIHDLRPVSMLPTGRIVGLETRDIATLSPALLKPNRHVRIGVAVGELESDEFQRQSSELAQNWNGKFLTVQNRRHFDVTTDLANGGPLADLAASLASATS
jgi:arylformamidase